MTKLLLLSICIVVANLATSAQTRIMPLIKASSRQIKILDGDDLQHGELVPSLRPDTYVIHPSTRETRVVFITDIDSISFVVKKGDTYDFVVVLNERDSCFQRITTHNQNKVTYRSLGLDAGLLPDTIPFTLGTNHAIHLQGTINNSKSLDLIFDTGASVGVLSETGRRKGAKERDGAENLQSVDCGR